MSQAPGALLFIATGCQHCPSVLQSLGELIKAGTLGQLEVVNIQQNPERAQEYGVRSVPWVKIGPFELVGMRSQGELKQWIERINDPSVMGEYFGELMTTGEMDKVRQLVEKTPELFSVLLELMADEKTSLSVRIGVGAIMEDFAGTKLLIKNIDALGKYTTHQNPRVRNDACHYLGLSKNSKAEKYIRPLLQDENAETREVAEEALEELE